MIKIKHQDDLIAQLENAMIHLEDKTPKRSGNSVHRSGYTKPPTTFVITSDPCTKKNPFHTPNVTGITFVAAETPTVSGATEAPTQGNTPTMMESQVYEWMKHKEHMSDADEEGGKEEATYEETPMSMKRKCTYNTETNGHTTYMDESD
jgi:hypothetical protein